MDVHSGFEPTVPIQRVTKTESGEQSMTEQQKVETPAPSPQSGIPSNTVFIGQKPIMAYVTAIVMHIGGSNEVTVKARGRAISAAVDVVEVCRRRFFEGKLHVKKITIGTEQLGEEGQVRNVSTIEITVAKST
jgi:archaea-specific DNA-binding protein